MIFGKVLQLCFFCSLSFVAWCSSSSSTSSSTVTVVDSSSAESSSSSTVLVANFQKVLKIVGDNCLECHSSNKEIIPLTNFSEISYYADLCKEKQKKMNDDDQQKPSSCAKLTPLEKETFELWVAEGKLEN